MRKADKAPGRRWTRRMVGLPCLLSLWGCLGERLAGTTGVGNPPQSALTFSMQAAAGPVAAKRSAAPDGDTVLTLADKSGTAFALRRALAHVGQVKLRLPDGVGCPPAPAPPCEAGNLKLAGPFVADLMAGTFSPAFPTLAAPHGEYRRVDIRLVPLDDWAASPETSLRGHTVLLAGTFAYAGRSDRAFTMVLDLNEEARFDSGSSRVREAPLNLLRLRMDAGQWLASADITGCLDDGRLPLDPSGNLRIDGETACEGLEQAIKHGIKGSGRLEDGLQLTSSAPAAPRPAP